MKAWTCSLMDIIQVGFWGGQVDDNHGVKKELSHTNKNHHFQDTTSSPDPKKNAHQQNRSTESLQEVMQINLCACDGRKLLF